MNSDQIYVHKFIYDTGDLEPKAFIVFRQVVLNSAIHRNKKLFQF